MSILNSSYEHSSKNSEYRFPGYDAEWLSSYVRVKEWLEVQHPDRLCEFEDLLEGFKTRSDFEICVRSDFLSSVELQGLQSLARALKIEQMQPHEQVRFDRFVLHNHPRVTELQNKLLGRVREFVKEDIEISYNLICRYQGLGSCPLHLDSPEAKWTLDICLDQTQDWPIYFSPTQTWPTDIKKFLHPDWAQHIQSGLQFKPVTMKPGDAVLFSGSAQWHYRERMPTASNHSYCDLVFFHFLPKGHSLLRYPHYWAQIMGLPEIKIVAGVFQPRPNIEA